MKAKRNFFSRSAKPVNIKLVGHTDTIKSLDVMGDYILTGSEDSLVKFWDIGRERALTFTEHMNDVTHTLILPNHLVSGGIDKHVNVRTFDLSDTESHIKSTML